MSVFEDFDPHIFDALGDTVIHLESGDVMRGVFDYEYYEAFERATRSATLTMIEPVQPVSRGDRFEIDRKVFKVVNFEPDGHGVVMYRLAVA